MDAERTTRTATGIAALGAGGSRPSGGQSRIPPQAYAQNRLLSEGINNKNMNWPGIEIPGPRIPPVTGSIGGMSLDSSASDLGMNMTETDDSAPDTTTLQFVSEGEQFSDEVLADMRLVKVRALSILSFMGMPGVDAEALPQVGRQDRIPLFNGTYAWPPFSP